MLFLCLLKEVNISVAKGKYQKWLEPEGITLITGWARDGLTEEQIAHNMGITRETLRLWKNKFFGISVALKKGKEVSDIEVENALYKRAIGYTYKETTKELRADKKTGESKLVVTKEVTKHIVPDTTAQIFWLKNRRPDKWRDKVQEGNSNANDPIVNINISPADFSEKTGDEQ